MLIINFVLKADVCVNVTVKYRGFDDEQSFFYILSDLQNSFQGLNLTTIRSR